jgi:hypothetical protein
LLGEKKKIILHWAEKKINYHGTAVQSQYRSIWEVRPEYFLLKFHEELRILETNVLKQNEKYVKEILN